MSCHYHPDRPVARECRMCHELICSECVVSVGADALCKSCVAEALTANGRPAFAAEPIVPNDANIANEPPKERIALDVLKDKSEALGREQKSKFLTVMFSILPGLGHYYLGLQIRGLNMMIAFFLIIFLNVLVPGVLTFPTAIAIPILWFYSQFDALKYCSLVNAGETVADTPLIPMFSKIKQTTLIGLLVAGFGVLGLFYKLLDLLVQDYILRNTIRDVVLAILLVGVGIWILKGKTLPILSTEESDEQKHA